MDGQPFFFCHIPKTAGSTFVDILENIFPQNEICPAYYTFELNNFTASQLESYRLFRGHIDYHVLGQFLPQRPKTLTFIRNPFDHAILIGKSNRRTPAFLRLFRSLADTGSLSNSNSSYQAKYSGSECRRCSEVAEEPFGLSY